MEASVSLSRLLLITGLVWTFCGPTRIQAQAAPHNPITPGDHPDPSIIRVGGTYWTSSTSGDWSPQYPLYRSNDLKHWSPAGVIFKQQPTWASGSFWAPELVYDRGRVLVYYVGRKRDGPLCVAVATAALPQGPYTDHGPIECQKDGSIDPAFTRDEHGTPYLIWKEDGNSIGAVTTLWAQPLTPDLLSLTGEKTDLLVNEPASWEGGVVEAPFVLRHGGYFYLFYAGNACCGVQCNYAEGVARSVSLLGPWMKDPNNPIIRPNGNWRCPGHGSAVTTPDGRQYFIYHAYPVRASIYLGRESVLDRITWDVTGWPAVNHGKGPSSPITDGSKTLLKDDFQRSSLAAGWRWPVNHDPHYAVGHRVLQLEATAGQDAFLAQSVTSAAYTASVDVRPGSDAALVVIGNGQNMVGIGRRNKGLEVWRTSDKGRVILWDMPEVPVGEVSLRVRAEGGGQKLSFAWKAGNEGAWQPAGESIDASALPQWDEGLRVGLEVGGKDNASFQHFRLSTP